MNRLLLIAVDYLDADLVSTFCESGKLPNIQALRERGTSNTLSSTFPKVSSMMWSTTFTGRRARQHGILSDVFFQGEKPTPVLSSELAIPTIWQILSEAGVHTSAINFPASHPAQELTGTSLSNRFMFCENNDPIEDPLTAGSVNSKHGDQRFKEFRVVADDLDEGIARTFVYDLDTESETQAPYLSQLSQALEINFSSHAATLEILNNDPWQCVGSYYSLLADLRMFSSFSDLKDGDYSCFRESYENAYRLLDLQLGELLKTVSVNDTVMLVSCNGITKRVSTKKTPRASERGYLIAAGPNIDSNQAVIGSIEDITPTILSHFSLAGACDMSGVSLTALSPRLTNFIDSYGQQEQQERRTLHPIEQLNRAIDSADCSDWRSAREDLETVYMQFPNNVAVHSLLSSAYFETGDSKSAERVLLDLIRRTDDTPQIHFSLAKLHVDLEDHTKAFHHSTIAMDLTENPQAFDYLRHAQTANGFGKTKLAIDNFSKAIEMDDGLAVAYQERARCYIATRNFSAAIEDSSKAIKLQSRSLQAYLCLAYALAETADITNAEKFYLIALKLGSKDPAALLQISAFHQKHKADSKRANDLLKRRDTLLEKKVQQQAEKRTLSELEVYQSIDEDSLFE